MGNSVVTKVGGTILVLFLSVIIPLGFVIDQIFSTFYYSEVRNEMDGLSKQYAAYVNDVNNMELHNMFNILANFTSNEIVLVNEEGKVVSSSGFRGHAKKFKLNEIELTTLSEEGPVEKEYVNDSGEKFLGIGRPIIQAGEFLGGVFVFTGIGKVDESIESIRNLLLLTGIGGILFAVVFVGVISKRLSAPLLEMEKVTRKMAKGDLQRRVEAKTGDEVGSLGRAINHLGSELQRYRTNQQEFLANISHELRTPITYLEGYSRIIRERLVDTEEERDQYLLIIEEEAKRLTTMINDLFDLAKMDEGKIPLDSEWVDLGEVCETAIEKTRWKAEEKGLSLVFNKTASPPIHVDGMRMEQVVFNLLDNAIRYTDNGEIGLYLSSDADSVNLEIKDTGEGIPEGELQHIFDRFYRVEKSRSRKLGGSGLGLSIVKNLVELQNGKIMVDSEVGKGTVFTIVFPRGRVTGDMGNGKRQSDVG